MKFLLDENTGKEVARFLEKLSHSAYRVRLISPGLEDESSANKIKAIKKVFSKYKNIKNKFVTVKKRWKI